MASFAAAQRAAAPEEKSPIESVRRCSLGCVKNGAGQGRRGRERARSGVETRGRDAARIPRSLMRAAYHNLISFNIWGEAVGCQRRAKVVTPGVDPQIFTILIIVSAWDSVRGADVEGIFARFPSRDSGAPTRFPFCLDK